MKFSIKTLNSFRKKLSEPTARFYFFAAFMAMVFFMGGGSRDDVQSLVVLRPLAIMFGAYALTCMTWQQWKGRMFPLFVAMAMLILMIFQVIPLPPSIWTELPGREMFADIAVLAGMEQPWRPLTLSPSRTLNSLFSLAVPISAMMLYLNLDEARRNQAILVIIVLAMVSALWAMFQLAGSSRGPLYLYNITNNGAAVGLMANRNHQAMLLAATIIMLGWYGAAHPPTMRLAAFKLYASVAAIFVLVPLVFVTGSRAGLLLMAPALIITMILVYNGRFISENQSLKKKKRRRKRPLISRQMVLAGFVAIVIGIAVLSVYFSRSQAYTQLFGGGDLEELRLQLLPTLIKMLSDYFPWGSGFGSFEYVYKISEPQELLKPTYLNQAHNDWLQFFLEGGLPTILIAAAAMGWFAIQLLKIGKNWRLSHYSKYAAIMTASAMLIFLGGSIGDYPLRVPSIIAVFAVLACFFYDNARAVQRRVI